MYRELSGHSLTFVCSCIEKWLKGRGERCPQCNGRAKQADIRVIFAKVEILLLRYHSSNVKSISPQQSLQAIDTSEKEAVVRELEKVTWCIWLSLHCLIIMGMFI